MSVLVGHLPVGTRGEAAALIAEARERQRRRRIRLAMVVLLAIGGGVASYGISQAVRGSSSPSPQCVAAARAVGYAVPCPARVPREFVQGGLQEGGSCGEYLVQAAGYGNCARVWRGWVLGSGWAAGAEHYVIAASPKPLSDTQLVDGPFWVKQTDRVRLLGIRTVNGRRMRMVYVPEQPNRYGATTNAGSAFEAP